MRESDPFFIMKWSCILQEHATIRINKRWWGKLKEKVTLRERYEDFYGCAYEDIDLSQESEAEVDFSDPVGDEIW